MHDIRVCLWNEVIQTMGYCDKTDFTIAQTKNNRLITTDFFAFVGFDLIHTIIWTQTPLRLEPPNTEFLSAHLITKVNPTDLGCVMSLPTQILIKIIIMRALSCDKQYEHQGAVKDFHCVCTAD